MRGILVLALPENWWAAVKWQCLGVFSYVTLPAACESGSTGRRFCNLYCPWGVNRAVQRERFAICTARGVRIGQYRRTVLHFVLPPAHDMSSTREENASSTA